MVRFLEVTEGYHKAEPMLINTRHIVKIYQTKGVCYIELENGKAKHIKMDYDSLKAYLGGMVLDA